MAVTNSFSPNTKIKSADVNTNFTDVTSGKGMDTSLGYAEVTSNQGSITTEVDLTNLTVTVTVPSGGKRVVIEAQVTFQSNAANDRAGMDIKESTTYLTGSSVHLGNANQDYTTTCKVVLTPSSGSHTYKLSGQRRSGTGTVQMSASSTTPAFIHVYMP